MELIREAVIDCLNTFRNSERLIPELDAIIKREGKMAYPVIFHVLASLEIDPEEAERYWHEIVDHYDSLTSLTGRKISLLTAICDYFCSIQKSLKNPKVVELHIFEQTIKDSSYDPLTGLFNRRYFEEALDRDISLAKRYNTELTILFFDLDNFKEINDLHGHLAGDDVLRAVAEIIQEEKRTGDTAVRYGGEEFIVVLPQTGSINGLVLGNRIRERIAAASIEAGDTEITLTISGGLASFPLDAEDAASLVSIADRALFQAKGAGKNNISLFSQDKRRFLRIGLNREITVKEFGFNGTAAFFAESKNIGMGGVLFENDSPLDIGTRVQISMPIAYGDPVLIVGNVVRVEAFGPDSYDIGVAISFLEMDKTVKHEIASYLKKAVPVVAATAATATPQ